MTNRTYNLFRLITTVLLPIVGSLYFVFGVALGWPSPGNVAGLTLILTAWFGFLVKVLSTTYMNNRPYEGTVVVTTTPEGKTTYRLEVDADLDELPKMESLRFKVDKEK